MKKAAAIALLILLAGLAAYKLRQSAQDVRNEQAIDRIMSATQPKPATQTPPRTDTDQTRAGARHRAATGR